MNIGVILSVLLAAWIAWDARNRMANWILWGIATLILWPIAIPLYLAQRPLKSGERREGGRAWNVLKNFALTWTLFMLVITPIAFVGAGAEVASEAASDAEAAGAALGMGLGLVFAGGLWFFVMLGAVIVGFFLRKSDVEEGPTGRLAQVATSQTASSLESRSTDSAASPQ